MAEDHGAKGSEPEGPAKRGPPDVTFTFEHDANAPATAARAALQETLNEPDDPIAWKVTLTASELAPLFQ